MTKITRTRQKVQRQRIPAPQDDNNIQGETHAPSPDLSSFIQRMQGGGTLPNQTNTMVQLQRSIGNRALTRLTQSLKPPLVQRARKRGRQAVNRRDQWRQLLVQRGVPALDAIVLATQYAPETSGVNMPLLLEFTPLLINAPLWTVNNVIALIGLYKTNARGRTASNWAGIAAELPNLEADVDIFARVAGWANNHLVTLANLFHANAGAHGQTSQNWADVAGAHANLRDQPADVTTLARMVVWPTPAHLTAMFAAGWTRPDLITFFNKLVTDGYAVASLPALIATVGFAASSFSLVNAGWNPTQTGAFIAAVLGIPTTPANLQGLIGIGTFAVGAVAMIGGGWTQANLGAFAGRALAQNATAISIDALFNTNGFPAASQAMIIAGWSVPNISNFVGAALVAGLSEANLNALMGTANFAASSHTMIGANWTAIQYGQYVAAARAAGLSAANLVAVQAVGGFPASSQLLIVAGWTPLDYGQYIATVHTAGLSAANIQAVQAIAGFDASSRAMIVAGWTPQHYGQYINAAHTAGLSAANIAAVQAVGGFPASSRAMVVAGFTPAQYGQLVTAAINQGTITPANFQAFQATGNADTACFALQGTWGATNIGYTVGYVLTRVNPPSNAEMVQLLQRANTYILQHAHMRNAALANTCNAPTWARVITHIPRFATGVWLGPGAGGGGPTTANFAHGVQPYNIDLNATAWLYNHVKKGHTYEYFDFSYPNCMRNNNGGNIGLYGPAINLDPQIGALVNDVGVRNMAEIRAQAGVNSFGAWPAGGHKIGLRRVVGANPNPRTVNITQYFPQPAANNFDGKDLVAIGRIYGRTL